MYAYLDHAATTPLSTSAREAMAPWLSGQFGNASSLHRRGKAARLAIEDAREAVAALVGGTPAEIVFTSGATEADNLAIRGAAWAMRGDHGRRHVVVSAIEHPAVLRAAEGLVREGFELDVVAVGKSGVLDVEALRARLRPDTALVSVMAVNNEIGTIQPVAACAAQAHAVGALFHCDAVQAAGWQHLQAGASEIDLLTLSAHKIGGPQGAGALYARRGLALAPLVVGGEQENQRRAGTENVAAIVGFGAAAAEVGGALAARAEALRGRGARLRQGILGAVTGSVEIGDPSSRAPHIASFEFDGVDAETLLFALDMAGLAVSSGSACSSHTLEPSPVLLAIGYDRRRALSTLRFSWGPATLDAEIDHALSVLPQAVERNRTAQAARR